jgi:hypothetical protein
MRGDIEVGAHLPDYELPDQDGVVRRLSDLQGSNPMVLHLSRGGFDRGEREQFLVSPVEGEAIRYTEGTEVGVKHERCSASSSPSGRRARPKRCLRPGPRSDQAPPVNDRASVGPTTRS